jgi:hypothetical protein
VEVTFCISDMLIFQTFPVADNSCPLATAQDFRPVSEVRVAFLLNFMQLSFLMRESMVCF